MNISRQEYLQKIKSYINKPLIKVITGQRRVWKTIFLQQLINQFDKEKVVYINKEDKDFDFLINDNDLNTFLENEIKSWKKYIFCDEIQNINSWEKSINSIFSKYKDVDIYISWSNSSLLSSELSTYLSWRYIQFQIFPFSYEEYLVYFNKEKNSQTFESYINIWGLPLCYNFVDDKIIYEFVSSLIDTIFIKDLIPRYKIKDTYLLKEVFLFLVNNIWNLTNLSKIIKYLESKNIKTNFHTLSTYVDILKSAYLIYEVNLYDLQWKQIFDRERKFYIWDHIFRKVFFSWYDIWMWKIIENITLVAWLRKGFNVYVGKIKEKEIDFVFEKNWKKIYIQVCYLLSDENVIKREFWNLELIKDNWPKYVVSMDNINFWVINWIKHINFYNLDDCFK